MGRTDDQFRIDDAVLGPIAMCRFMGMAAA